jgi:hypothetical protein|tara:strand:- start:2951 stop:3109 length:159 start_codon:yes stop_codon:yes gene_type:complete
VACSFYQIGFFIVGQAKGARSYKLFSLIAKKGLFLGLQCRFSHVIDQENAEK